MPGFHHQAETVGSRLGGRQIASFLRSHAVSIGPAAHHVLRHSAGKRDRRRPLWILLHPTAAGPAVHHAALAERSARHSLHATR